MNRIGRRRSEVSVRVGVGEGIKESINKLMIGGARRGSVNLFYSIFLFQPSRLLSVPCLVMMVALKKHLKLPTANTEKQRDRVSVSVYLPSCHVYVTDNLFLLYDSAYN